MSAAALATPPRRACNAFAVDLLDGLQRRDKRIPSKYFYDNEGSELFERITALPEYYPTRTELSILHERAGDIASLIGPDAELVEFGAGSLRKVRILLDALKSPRSYVPIDIADEYLAIVAKKLEQDYPNLTVTPVTSDFTLPVVLENPGSRRVGFLPGSTLGNFTHTEAVKLLRSIRHTLDDGGLLVGIDLIKSPRILHAAYNDAEGITAAFNKNVLGRANRELDADFDLAAFEHHACYNPFLQKIEMHLVSMRRQRVRVLDDVIELADGEAIHTEDSHKYTVGSFRALAAEAGYTSKAHWTDEANFFSVFWLEACHDDEKSG